MILGRYIFREIFTSALLGAVLSTFVIFLQQLGSTFLLLLRASAGVKTTFTLLGLAMPPVLPLTLPFGVLVGILIGLGRLASDNELVAMRAAGVPARYLLKPVLAFAILAAAVTGAASVWLTPLAFRTAGEIVSRIAPDQITAQIQPRIFEEQFSNSNTILYVQDVRPGKLTEWQGVFIADTTAPAERSSGLREKADGPMITIARRAFALPDPDNNRVQLSLEGVYTHEIGADGKAYDSDYPRGEQTLSAQAPAQRSTPPYKLTPTRDLFAEASKSIEAAIELHRRFALPAACIMLALVGLPLGAATRKGGRSAGYITAIVLAFFVYHLSSISLVGLAKQQTLSPAVAVWLPNAAFLIGGVWLLWRMERSSGLDLIGGIRRFGQSIFSKARTPVDRPTQGGIGFRFLPLIVDTYLLQQFLFYFAILLVTLVLLIDVYNFFELLGEMVRNRIAMSKMVTYLVFLAPKLIYDTTPFAVLVGVLATFGVLAKNNEVVAFKASGVSLYRLSVPVLLGGLAISGSLFAFDYYYVPEANRRQDALRDEIKGKPVQTYLRPDRKWILGGGSRVYYYIHFDTTTNVMVGLNVYELDQNPLRLKTHISAGRAEWHPRERAWVFKNGFRRDLTTRSGASHGFARFDEARFPEIVEPPSYFLKEVKQDKQMNFWELEQYIGDLKRSGFDTVRLQVQFHKKFAVPLVALIMAMISVPFGFLVGNRGAMAGIGVGLGIAIAYLGVSVFFEQVGNVSQLPPAIAAWSPDAVFFLIGSWLLLRVRT